MKVTFTKTEITAIILTVLYLPLDTTVEVVDDPPKSEPKPKSNLEVANELGEALRKVGCVDLWGCIRPDKKLLAIKTLRESIPNCGLAVAKYAIEDWDVFLAYVTRNGIPDMTSGCVTWS